MDHPLDLALYRLPAPEAPVCEVSDEEIAFHMTQLGYYPRPGTDGENFPGDFVDPPQSFTAWAVQNRHRPALVAAIVDEICYGAKIGAWVGLEANV